MRWRLALGRRMSKYAAGKTNIDSNGALIIPPTTCQAGREIEVRTYGVSGGAGEKAFFITVN